MSRRWSPLGPWPLLVAALVLLGGTAVLLWLMQRRPAPLRLAITDWPAYEYFYLAQRQGLDRPRQLDLRVSQHSSLADQRQSYARGEVQAFATTLGEAIAACQDSPPRCPVLVLALDESAGADLLLAREPIRSVAQLRGRRVGLEQSVLGLFILMRALQRHGLSLNDVRLQYQGPVELVQSLRQGQLEAIVSYPPYATALQGQPGIATLFTTREIPAEVVDVLAVDPQFLRQHPDQVRRLVALWWDAQAYARAHPAASLALMAGRERLSVAAFQAAQQGIRYPDRRQQAALLAPRGPLARSLAEVHRLMRQQGHVSPDTPLPRLDPSLAAAAP